jgi:hypothetical protein
VTSQEPIEIFGPPGVFAFLEVALSVSQTHLLVTSPHPEEAATRVSPPHTQPPCANSRKIVAKFSISKRRGPPSPPHNRSVDALRC